MIGRVIVKLKELCDLQNGFAFKSKDYIAKSNVMNFRMSQIRPGGKVDLNHGAKYLPENFKEKYNDFILNEGDIVIAMTDMASDTKILGVPTQIKKNNLFLLQNQRVGKIKGLDTKIVDVGYLRYMLTSPQVYSYYKQFGKGGVQINLGKDDILNAEIPLAPLLEQKRIVSKIEELFSELDKGIETLKTAQQQLKVYRQAVLKSAFEGKLTLEQRERGIYPDVNNLIKSIKILGSENKIKLNYKFVEKDDELPEIPSLWSWIRNEELLKYVTSGSRDWKKYYNNTGSIFIRTQDIKTNLLDFDKAAFVNLPEKVEGKRSLVEPYDLLMTITGANVGKVAIVPENIPEAYVSQSVALMKLLDKRMSKYLWYYFQSRKYGEGLIGGLVYGVGRPVLSLENMKEVPVAICSIEEQKHIVQEIESRISVCDKIEESIEKGLQQAEALRQSILKKAFEGKLVAQDPNDKPASVLLERIKSERLKAQPEKNIKTKKVKA